MNWDRVERRLGVAALAHLQQQTVAVIGLGSGGGFVSTGLAMSGVGRFLLIDDELLEAENLVRHVADQRALGRQKAEAVAELIGFRNPAAQVEAVIGRLEDHLPRLREADLVVCAVDGEGTKFLLNEYCLQQGLAAVYAGVYERGEGGDVTLIDPQHGPCYACWAANLREGYVPPTAGEAGQLDYGLRNERGTLDAEPGLWLDVVRVAAVQADVALNWLLRDTPSYRQLPANTVILANHALEIITGQLTPPYSAEWVNIPRDAACLVCGTYRQTASTPLSLDEVAGNLLRLDTGEDNHGHS